MWTVHWLIRKNPQKGKSWVISHVPIFHIIQPWKIPLGINGLLNGYYFRWCPIYPSHGTFNNPWKTGVSKWQNPQQLPFRWKQKRSQCAPIFSGDPDKNRCASQLFVSGSYSVVCIIIKYYIYIHIYICDYIYIYTWLYIWLYICMCIYIYIYIHVCTYMHMYNL